MYTHPGVCTAVCVRTQAATRGQGTKRSERRCFICTPDRIKIDHGEGETLARLLGGDFGLVFVGFALGCILFFVTRSPPPLFFSPSRYIDRETETRVKGRMRSLVFPVFEPHLEKDISYVFS